MRSWQSPIMSNSALLNMGAIVSVEIGQSFLFAARSEPVDDADSGWQFSVDAAGGGDPDSAQIWALEEVLEREPSLRPFIALPLGAVLRRMGADDKWTVTDH
jgi:hypothetical protein